MIQPGELLQNRYRVLKQIGQGGMGAVYVATDERFHSTVAIKQTFFDDPVLRKAFEREAHLLNHLRHVALPRVSDHFIEGEGQFLVMEFIEGDDLAELLQKGAAFPLAEVLRWADELLDALDYLHTHEPPIVHRDIKPQNLKLTPRGQVVLLDFGLAKGAAASQTRASATASVFGYSRNYAPLEQIQGTGTDTRSDLYSLGATMYHLLTGVAPVDGLTRASAVINNQPDPLRPAHLTHAQVPESVSKILHRAMFLKATLRPATAAQMRAALRHATAAAAGAMSGTTQQAASALTTKNQTSRYEATVIDSATQLSGGHPPAPSTLSQTRLRPSPVVARTHNGTPAVDNSFDATQLALKPSPHTSFQTLPRQSAREKSPALIIGVALAMLIACAFVAFPLLRRPVVLPASSEAQTGTQPGTAVVGEQPVAPDTTQTDAARETSNPASASNFTPSNNLSRPAGETQTPTSQPASREAATGVSVVDTDGSQSSPPAAVESSSDKSGSVVQAPAPSSALSNKNAAAEYDAQRAEELRRKRQQQELELQRQRQREQQPQHGLERHGPPPPLDGGRRPPPRRPPLFP